jgi:hypothetical protein
MMGICAFDARTVVLKWKLAMRWRHGNTQSPGSPLRSSEHSLRKRMRQHLPSA